MLLFSASTIAGFALLIWGADRFVVGAAGAARNFGLPTLLIGLTVVAIATSAPEILVSITAALHDNTELAVGNAIGSNIANIALVLGATAVVRPMIVRSTVLRREMPALLAVTLLTVMLFLDTYLGILDGIILLGGLVLVMQWLVRLGSQANDDVDPIQEEIAAEIPSDMSTGMALSWLALGLVVLLVGARMLVWGAHHIAINLGVSDLVIGLTIVAVGTSLPELATAIVAAFRRHSDVVIGNVIGSNIFNVLAILGTTTLVQPIAVGDQFRTVDALMVVGSSAFLLALLFATQRIGRGWGACMLATYAGYTAYLFQTGAVG